MRFIIIGSYIIIIYPRVQAGILAVLRERDPVDWSATNPRYDGSPVEGHPKTPQIDIVAMLGGLIVVS